MWGVADTETNLQSHLVGANQLCQNIIHKMTFSYLQYSSEHFLFLTAKQENKSSNSTQISQISNIAMQGCGAEVEKIFQFA